MFVPDLNQFVTVHPLEEAPAVLSPGSCTRTARMAKTIWKKDDITALCRNCWRKKKEARFCMEKYTMVEEHPEFEHDGRPQESHTVETQMEMT